MSSKVRKYLFLIGAIAVNTINIFAQEKVVLKSITVNPMYGFIVQHRPGFSNLVLGHIPSVDINAEFVPPTSKTWPKLYTKSKNGFGLSLTDFANPKELGQGVALYRYMDFNMFKTPLVENYTRVGCGLGYTTKTFDRFDNYKNILIGSKLNVFISFRNRFYINYSPKLAQTIDISFQHFSNGAYQMPNLGINVTSVGTGVRYTFHPTKRDSISNKSNFLRKEANPSHFFFVGSFGVKEPGKPEGPKYFMSSWIAQYHLSLSRKSALRISADFFTNPTLPVKRELSGKSGGNIIQSGITFGYGIKIENAIISAAQGVYTSSLSPLDGWLYHRVSYQYYFGKNWMANFSLKAHFFRADYLEFGFGYKIGKSKNEN